MAVLLVSSVFIPNTIAAQDAGSGNTAQVFGFTDFSKERSIEEKFLAGAESFWKSFSESAGKNSNDSLMRRNRREHSSSKLRQYLVE